MKLFLSILILTFSLQSLAKADDIKDLEIEGMSVEDSLLNFIGIEEIKEEIKNKYKFKSDNYTVIEFYKKNFFTTYDSIQVALMKNDKNFIIKGIAGMIFYTENTAACHNKVEEVEVELSEMFSGTKKIERATEPHINDKNSTVTDVYFVFKDKGAVVVSCYDWSPESEFTTNFRVSVRSAKYREWLMNDAY